MAVTDPAIVERLEQRYRPRAKAILGLYELLQNDHFDWWGGFNAIIAAAADEMIDDQNGATHPVLPDEVELFKSLEDAIIAAVEGPGVQTILHKLAVTAP